MRKRVRCVKNSGVEATLEIGKVYEVASARPKGWLRVIDESGEDHLLLSHWFEEVHDEGS